MSTTNPSSANPGHGPNGAARNGSPASSSPPSTPAAAADRDARGRFTANNKGGPGNPFARRVANLRQALLEAVAPEDLRAIIGKMVEAAKQGDVAAARLVLAYGVGKPAPAVDPDTLEIQEWALWQKMPVLQPMLMDLMGPLQVPLANIIARIMVPLCQASFGKQMAEQIDPTLAVPPVPNPAQPQASASAAPQGKSVPTAPVGQPAPRPESAPPSARVASNGAKAQARKEKHQKESAGPAAKGPVRPAANEAKENHAGNQAELLQLLATFQQLLGPAQPARDNPFDLDPDEDLEADWQT